MDLNNSGAVGGGSPAPSAPVSAPVSAPAPSGGSPAISPNTPSGGGDWQTRHAELERRLGEQGQELGRYRDYHDKATAFLKPWQPLLAKVNYNPQAFAEVLDRVAQREAQAGHPQQAAQAQAAAAEARKWGDAISPDDQQSWIEDAIGRRLSGFESQLVDVLSRRFAGLEQYLQRYGEFALRAMEARAGNQDLTLQQILEGAVQHAQSAQDPIEAAVQRLTGPKRSAAQQQAREAQLRKEWEAEQASKGTATFGAGSTAPRPFRMAPRPGQSQATPAPVSTVGGFNRAMAEAKARAIQKLAALPAPE
jgi:hypothetical protein